MTTEQYSKKIKYNRYTHDYDLLLDDEFVGSARTHHEGEVRLDRIVYDILNKPQLSIADTCPSCGDPLPTGARLCASCAELMSEDVLDKPPQPDLTTDLYNVVCLTLSGAAATTAIAELRRVQARYEKEMGK